MDFQAFFLILATLSLDYLVATASVPALFAFGDSLVDAGDNEHLNTQARANHPPYGIDFENHQATGRFSNGCLVVDLIASYLGLPYPPAYYGTKNFQQGANFGSASSGVLPNTHTQGAQTLPQQVDDFQSMASQLQQQLGSNESSSLVSQSIFYICIGNNDVNNEFEQRKNLSTDFLQSVLDGVMEQMHRLYEMGARKFVVVGLSAVGCIPLNVQRDGSCAPVAQAAASSYNTMLRSALDEMSSTHQGIHIVLTNFYDLMVDTNTNPQQFGFEESTRACCEMGSRVLNCNDGVNICPDRSKYAFWDGVHQTEAFNKIAAARWWNGTSSDVHPFSIGELAAL
ncbi:hypothetical protein SELMODRAFT_421228 [Selaginella moellendorffii]|uniref:SGNH hydrolase-type esterase domain-containing protein n=1 Tax=Selaginella moellendorffii TaxID=88036 RepID=D8SEE8_SELML|nr:hypothetical protein SELMODRAFT_421228 [Selaginella moellendorffii]